MSVTNFCNQEFTRLEANLIGQSGIRIARDRVIYIDPYLSNSVELLDSEDLVRRVAIPFSPGEVKDADFVLITHEHLDHCDPHTIPIMAMSSPEAKFVGPGTALELLRAWGVEEGRLIVSSESTISLSENIELHAVPAAHPEILRDKDGNLCAVGYVLVWDGYKIYISGDTFARQEIIDRVRSFGGIDIAFVPINEHNFFLGRRGILGNMSPREAFQFATEIGAKRVVPTHWDMFEVNSVDLDEARVVYRRFADSFELVLDSGLVSPPVPRVSVIIRTLNEEMYLDQLLYSIEHQLKTKDLSCEKILVDSGSSDSTIDIAIRHGCRVFHISKEDFSFGRSLNIGCENARGEILVFVSGHCVPTDNYWLKNLCDPLIDGVAEYSYGRQIGGNNTRFSERKIFAKYFPAESKFPQEGFYCNNANAALLRKTWQHYRFNEDLTGLEDMELGKRLVADRGSIAYVSTACVYHHHDESWRGVRRRFEREAIALQAIMPQLQVTFWDTFRYFTNSVVRDWFALLSTSKARDRENNDVPASSLGSLPSIVSYRFNQYWGTYRGNRELRKLTRVEKERYFYPK